MGYKVPQKTHARHTNAVSSTKPPYPPATDSQASPLPRIPRAKAAARLQHRWRTRSLTDRHGIQHAPPPLCTAPPYIVMSPADGLTPVVPDDAPELKPTVTGGKKAWNSSLPIPDYFYDIGFNLAPIASLRLVRFFSFCPRRMQTSSRLKKPTAPRTLTTDSPPRLTPPACSARTTPGVTLLFCKPQAA